MSVRSAASAPSAQRPTSDEGEKHRQPSSWERSPSRPASSYVCQSAACKGQGVLAGRHSTPPAAIMSPMSKLNDS
jgi:hypothetical protein